MGTQYIRKHSQGFTIVELIIVIVVIGILAAITIISYSIVTTNARAQAVSTDLQSVASQLAKSKSDNGRFPATSDFSTMITPTNTSGKTTYTYNYNETTGAYCLVATGYGASYYVTDTKSQPTAGSC